MLSSTNRSIKLGGRCIYHKVGEWVQHYGYTFAFVLKHQTTSAHIAD